LNLLLKDKSEERKEERQSTLSDFTAIALQESSNIRSFLFTLNAVEGFLKTLDTGN
jgi:hypothetical protein